VKLQETLDSVEHFKKILKQENIDYKEFTIYEFFFNLNEALKPKKQQKQ